MFDRNEESELFLHCGSVFDNTLHVVASVCVLGGGYMCGCVCVGVYVRVCVCIEVRCVYEVSKCGDLGSIKVVDGL